MSVTTNPFDPFLSSSVTIASGGVVSTAELLHQCFEHQADVRPEQVAVECGRRSMTYGELEREANRMAHVLRSRGVGRGSFVALLLPRSIEMYAAILAVLKSGAAYVPLDPGYPADRVGYILDDVGAQVLLTSTGLAARVVDFAGCTIDLDAQHDEIAAAPSRRLPRDRLATPRDLCYVIYTSGSTGRPKGVEIEHASACHLVKTEGGLFRVQPRDRVFQGFSIAFDASVEEIWLALAAGATLVAGTSDMLQAGPDLARILTEARVSVLSCVPTLLAMMEGDIPSVRLLILGGETCPQQLVGRWWRPQRRVFNTYGPTEATVIATAAECHPDRPVTIGRPIAGYSVYLLDDAMRPVAPGEP
ncbi:MAG TPA: AMP-binding protein, partial [Pirellulales bacterium]|nr:AMP-binding protein [Pirellulales bacterium]